jgi:malate synthase
MAKTTGIEVTRDIPDAGRVLTPEALEFVALLHREFNETREGLLARRADRQRRLDVGEKPSLLPETADVRRGSWRVSAPPARLLDRRVEITGPVDRKMMINALNSGATGFMADLEDSLSPTWDNILAGHANLIDAVRGTLALTTGGREYRLNREVAVLLVRPRGWHLVESHLRVDGAPVSASLFDFGLAFFHNAREQLARGAGPFFYLPKMESHLEARLWNDVISWAERRVGIPVGTVAVTVLIETILAAFEMDEILYELRDHGCALNAGRWDYIFSIIKKFRADPAAVLPDRAQVTMTVPFMRAYTRRLVETCHHRGAQAIGGMAAFIPSRRDAAVNEVAMARVHEDKAREASAGFDGTWVAHPDLVAVALEEFADARPRRDAPAPDGDVAPLVDFRVSGGVVTAGGVRGNVRVALQYIEAWMRGSGAVAINNLMEDTATAEIARAQLWQWIRHRTPVSGGSEPVVTREMYQSVRREEIAALVADASLGARWGDAAALLDELVLSEEFVEFLTIPGSRYLG